MTNEELALIEIALKSHLNLLDDWLENKNAVESHLYLPIAGQLRVLLCDAELPILLAYSQAKQVPLFIYGPRVLPESLREKLALEVNPRVASWVPYLPQCEHYKIEDYLDIPIGWESLENTNGPSSYSPRQLIKWIANKDGVCHFDFHKPATYEKIKAWKWNSQGVEYDNGFARHHILQIGEWCRWAIRNLFIPVTDISIVARFTLLKQPDKKYFIFKAASSKSGLEVWLSACPDKMQLEIVHSSMVLNKFDLFYPKTWNEGSDCLFALVYDSASCQSSVFVNDSLVDIQKTYRLDSLAGEGASGISIKGFDQFIRGNFSLFASKKSTDDFREIMTLPTDWITAAKAKEAQSPDITTICPT